MADEVEQKKIIRIIFKMNGGEDEFTIDRNFNTEQNAQENCDGAINALLQAIHDGAVLPALRHTSREADAKPEHIILHLGNILYIAISDVRIYALEQPK
jgi:hypothetical protein